MADIVCQVYVEWNTEVYPTIAPTRTCVEFRGWVGFFERFLLVVDVCLFFIYWRNLQSFI